MNRIRLIVLVAALAIVGAACSAAPHAAVVNDTSIADDDVYALRTAEIGATAAGEQFRSDLTTLIVGQVTIDAAAEQYGITGLDTDEGREAFLATATEQELSIITNVTSNPELTDFAVDVVTTQLAVRSAVQEALASDPAVLEEVWEEDQALLIEVCPRHILTATEEEADAARDRVLAGEDFSAVADEVSLDTFSAGGELPCPSNPAAYVEPFATVTATAPVGEVTLPFETQFGWHIVVVDSREFPQTYEEFAADATRWVPADVIAGAWTNWRDDALGAAEIVVRSQIGTWFPQGDGILPPPKSP